MTAIVQRRRKKTAKESARALGISERTVRRHLAEARDDYETRATERKAIAARLRDEGKTWPEIAAAVGGTEWAARALVRRARLAAEPEPTGRPGPA